MCDGRSFGWIQHATTLHQYLTTETNSTHKQLKVSGLDSEACTFHDFKKLPKLLKMPLQTLNRGGHIKLRNILTVRGTVTNVVYIWLSTVRIAIILQHPTDHPLIGLRGCFETHGEYHSLVQAHWRHKCSVGAGAVGQMHLVKTIFKIEDGPDGILGLF